jgi:hypothetical protein
MIDIKGGWFVGNRVALPSVVGKKELGDKVLGGGRHVKEHAHIWSLHGCKHVRHVDNNPKSSILWRIKELLGLEPPK